MKHANISIFIPHNGCQNQCSFCNQKEITGLVNQPAIEEVVAVIEDAKKKMGKTSRNAEIAFFGGSFTAIDKELMEEYLKAVLPYVKSGAFAGIRVSTRPDAITPEMLDILKKYSVTAIELGAQSMDDEVLKKNNRGHTEEDVVNSSNMIKNAGFSLGLQMMTGLYSSTAEKDYETGEKIVKLKPDTVRIYPTVIMKGTRLHDLYNSGEYVPMSFDDTVDICSRLLMLFRSKGISVIRVGLHDSTSLKENIIAGAWHPAFREICESNILLKKLLFVIGGSDIKPSDITVYVNSKTVSKMIGHKRANVKKLYDRGYTLHVKTDDSINENNFRLDR